MTFHFAFFKIGAIAFLLTALTAWGEPLSVEDFTFEGHLGSQGATIEQVGENHFEVTLGAAPGHPDWNNKLQFTIEKNAKGNDLRLDVVFLGGDAYIFNEYFHSWSYDGENWTPVHWEHQSKDSKKGDTLLFPTFTEDRVLVGHQVPMSYEDSVALIENWKKDPRVTVSTIGKSLGGRDLYRIEITDPKSEIPLSEKWVHYFGNQHPGEHNSQWRMVGMIDWLLSSEGEECLDRTLFHFVLMMSPDAPSHGWYRVNAQGFDMNRTYLAGGSDKEMQAHEAFLWQEDLENLMRSEAPPTTAWSMHTWGGIVEPLMRPGPEFGAQVGPWTGLKDVMESHDTQDLIKPLDVRTGGNPTYWDAGVHLQFGITTVLCEGAGILDTKQQNLDTGVVIAKALCEFYQGTKANPVARNTEVMEAFHKAADATIPKMAWNANTLTEHQWWRKGFKEKMIELLGRMPDPVPLEVEWEEKIETDKFTRHKIYVRSEKNYWVPAYYFVPKEATGPRPAVVCLHGHSGILPYIGEGDEKQVQKSKELSLDYAVYLAEHGYVTIAPVLRGWNETIADPDQGGKIHSCRRVTMDAFLLGMTPMGLKCWDAMRLVDFLETQEAVDSEKIGAAGLSGGGTLAMYLHILDDRIVLSMVAGAFSTYRASIYSIPHCICNCLPGVLQYGEMADVMALHAPKPLLLINGTEDPIFPVAEARAGFQKLQRVYSLLGVPENVEADFFEGPHAWSNAKTLPFLENHWK